MSRRRWAESDRQCSNETLPCPTSTPWRVCASDWAPGADRSTCVHPYLLKEYNRRWFLFAASERDGKLLCFGPELVVLSPAPIRQKIRDWAVGLAARYDS